MNRQFTKEERKMADKHMKKGSTVSAIRKAQSRTTLRFHLNPEHQSLR